MSEEDSPMIAPPPGLIEPKSKQAAPADAATDAVSTELETFITLPPGTFDSGTYRVANPRVVPARAHKASEDIVFFPSGVGAPAPAAAVAPAALLDAVQQWRLVLPGGIGAKAVEASLFIGRNPARAAERPEAELLPLVDPAKSLSKTHALLEVDDGVLWVHDLDSTNGVF
ncbi:MAG: FHA domain-containing protein, partial [Lacisediminihabitans sp.]